MFEQDVAGLIKALRANKNDEASVIQTALDEIRKEIKSKDVEVKAAAVLKLVYLEMLGHSISFASFAIVECMTSTKYHIKSIGYLAASQCFDRETEVAVLVVNLVKKDLTSPPTPAFSTSPSSLTVAHLTSTLSSVSLLLTPNLARDLTPDLLVLLNHSRAQVRKQMVLVLWRVVTSWPGVMELTTGREERGQDPWIERLRERLSDDDVGVVSATVNLICEMARKQPRKFLPLAPELFELLTMSTNNWMLIKIIKLFAVLTPEEPRLVKKLVPPLTELIETTGAMSLLFECIQTSIVGGMLNGREGEHLASTCVDKLKAFLEDVDQNLRYIALVALVKILPSHPHLVSIHYDTILSCVDDADFSIRMRALDLVEGMVTKQSLQQIVTKLMTQLQTSHNFGSTNTSAQALLQTQQTNQSANSASSAPAPVVFTNSYRTSLILLILRMTSFQTYAHVANFAWLIDTLVELSYVALALAQDENSSTSVTSGRTSLGDKLSEQLIDVCARVKAIRPHAVKRMSNLLGDEEFSDHGEGGNLAQVLGAAAWICGEYCQELADPRPVIASLFGTSTKSWLPAHTLSLYLHNGVKIYSHWLELLSADWQESSLDQIRSISNALEIQLKACDANKDVELAQRAAELNHLLELVRKGLDAPRSIKSSQTGSGSDSLDVYDAAKDSNSVEGNSTEREKELPAPNCLLLLRELFTSHELNPVNPKAQSMVAVPEGLDLDQIIVPSDGKSRRIDLDLSEDEGVNFEVDGFGRRFRAPVRIDSELNPNDALKKKKKSTKTGISSKKKSKKVNEIENSEEIERLRAERIAREREDPFHVGTSNQTQDDVNDDVDSIPIVKLDLSFHTTPNRKLSPPPREITPPPVHVEIDGEMPEGIEPIQSEPPGNKDEAEGKEVDQAAVADREAKEKTVVTKVVKKKKGEGKTGTKKKKVKEVRDDLE